MKRDKKIASFGKIYLQVMFSESDKALERPPINFDYDQYLKAEQERLKREFLEAAQTTVEDDNDDLFKIKEKTQQEIEDENEEFRKFLEKESKVKKPEEVDILKRFWGDESKLDENERFLRRYILTKG